MFNFDFDDFGFDDFEVKSSGMSTYFDEEDQEGDIQRLANDSERRVRAKMEGREVTAQGERSGERRISAKADELPDRIKVSSLRDLDEFVRVAEGVFTRTGNNLVRESEKDLWTLNENDGGELVIERMFDENGDPVEA